MLAIDRCHIDNPMLMAEVSRFLASIPPAAMSSDESDPDDNHTCYVKPVSWRAKGLARLLHACDTYKVVVTQSGNRSRTHIAGRPDTTRTPPAGLPGNFYNEDYVNSLGPLQRDALNMQSAVAIPMLVRLMLLTHRVAADRTQPVRRHMRQ